MSLLHGPDILLQLLSPFLVDALGLANARSMLLFRTFFLLLLLPLLLNCKPPLLLLLPLRLDQCGSIGKLVVFYEARRSHLTGRRAGSFFLSPLAAQSEQVCAQLAAGPLGFIRPLSLALSLPIVPSPAACLIVAHRPCLLPPLVAPAPFENANCQLITSIATTTRAGGNGGGGGSRVKSKQHSFHSLTRGAARSFVAVSNQFDVSLPPLSFRWNQFPQRDTNSRLDSPLLLMFLPPMLVRQLMRITVHCEPQ